MMKNFYKKTQVFLNLCSPIWTTPKKIYCYGKKGGEEACKLQSWKM